MSTKELKLTVSNSGLRTESGGFVEKWEFVALVNSYLDEAGNQDECPVCLQSMNLGMRTICLPCKHLMCESCVCSVVPREDVSCTCPLSHASVLENALAIGMKGAELTASILLGGYGGNDSGMILDRAEAQFWEALHREPHHVGFLTTLADLVFNKGNSREAEMLCRRAIYFDPGNYAGFATLASVYKEMDKPLAALNCYEKALSLTDNPDVRVYLSSPITLHSYSASLFRRIFTSLWAKLLRRWCITDVRWNLSQKML